MTCPTDDATLVMRARLGDTLAFERLARRHTGPVYRIAWRILGDTADAADATQETFLTAWRRLHEIRAEQAFAAWLYRIVTTRALNIARTRRPSADLTHTDPPAGAATDPEQHAIATDLQEALMRALGRLTPQQRACWVLRELEGMSYEEITDITHASPDAVRGRVHRARIRLAEELTSWQ